MRGWRRAACRTPVFPRAAAAAVSTCASLLVVAIRGSCALAGMRAAVTVTVTDAAECAQAATIDALAGRSGRERAAAATRADAATRATRAAGAARADAESSAQCGKLGVRAGW